MMKNVLLGSAVAAGKFLPLMILLVLVMVIGGVATVLYQREIQVKLDRYPMLSWFILAMWVPTTNSVLPLVENAWRYVHQRAMALWFFQASAMMSLPLFALRQTGFAGDSPLPLRMYITGLIISLLTLPLARPIYRMTEWVMSRF
jgi:hypothetical protein